MSARAINAADWHEQLQYIEGIENKITELIDDDSLLDDELIVNWFQIFSQYLQSDNKNVLQRSLKLLDAIGQFDFNAPKNVTGLCQSIVSCISDQRQNIRQQAIRTILSLSSKIPLSTFFSQLDEDITNFNSDSRSDLLQFILSQEDILSIDDWKCFTQFIVQCLEDKSSSNKNIIQELLQNEKFLTALEESQNRLSTLQRKLIAPYLEKRPNYEKPIEEEKPVERKPQTTNSTPVFLNTSAFSRKSRNHAMHEDDGIKLLNDASAYQSLYDALAQDIRDVFEDELSQRLLSPIFSERLSAIDSLRVVFESSSKNFQNSVDIVLRWSGIQFLMRQTSVAQQCLVLLLDNLIDKMTVSKIELYFIIPIVLWSIATKSDAYSDLLTALRQHSKPADFAAVMLYCLQLGHTGVITTVFEELEQIEDLSSVEQQLCELSRHKLKIIADPAKSLLFRMAPKKEPESGGDPIAVLQSHIKRIRTIPDFINDPQALFAFLYDQFVAKPTDERLVRYLLYCTHAFLSEPILASAIDSNDLGEMLHLFLEFSLGIPFQFIEPMNAIGFIMVTLIPALRLYEVLFGFIEDHIAELTRNSVAYQVFITANSLICLDRAGSDLSQLHARAKEMCAAAKEKAQKGDLRIYLYTNLIKEIVNLESSRRANAEYFAAHRSFTSAPQPEIPEPISPKVDLSVSERLQFVRIVDRLGTPATRSDAIDELIVFDEENDCNGAAIDAVLKLAPMLRHEIEQRRAK